MAIAAYNSIDLFIDGKLVPGGSGRYPTINPATEETLAEVAELVWAAGGRTLGLFASQRAAEAAALHCRRELPA